MNVDQCDIYRMWYKEEDLTTEYDIQNLKPIKDKFFQALQTCDQQRSTNKLIPFMMRVKK